MAGEVATGECIALYSSSSTSHATQTSPILCTHGPWPAFMPAPPLAPGPAVIFLDRHKRPLALVMRPATG